MNVTSLAAEVVKFEEALGWCWQPSSSPSPKPEPVLVCWALAATWCYFPSRT